MSGAREKKKNLDGDRNVTKPTCTVHTEEIQLFCMDCQEILCIECMLDKHQQHSVKSLSKALDMLKEKVKQLKSDETVLSGIQSTNEKLQNLMETSKQTQIVYKSELRESEKDLKEKIIEEMNNLSCKVQEAFRKFESRLQDRIDEVTECKKAIEKLNVESMSLEDMLQLCCKVKKFQSQEFEMEMSALIQPTLCLNQDVISSIGFLKHNPNEDTMSQVAIEALESEKTYPIRISPTSNLSLDNVTKIVPVGNKEAWIISSRKIHYLKIPEIKAFWYLEKTDDIVWPGNGDLLVMELQYSVIKQITSRNVVTVFTRTDPYRPLSMTYLKDSKNVMILMESSTMSIFGLDGIQTKRIVLPIPVNDAYVEAFSDCTFALVRRSTYKKTLNTVNTIFSLKGEPKSTSKEFSGIFGSDPSATFICKGICYDHDSKIIISDYRFNTIYRLDENLKLQKVLIDKLEGLHHPCAMAFSDGLLWIADNNRISVYQYSDIA